MFWFWFCFLWLGLTDTQWLAWTSQRSVCLCCRTLFWLGGLPSVAPRTGFYIRGLTPTSSCINFMCNATFLSCPNKSPNLKNQNKKCSHWTSWNYLQLAYCIQWRLQMSLPIISLHVALFVLLRRASTLRSWARNSFLPLFSLFTHFSDSQTTSMISKSSGYSIYRWEWKALSMEA